MAADITVTTAQVAAVHTVYGKARIYDFVAAEAITIGDAVCIHPTNGTLHPADATAGGAHLIQCKGIALNAGGAGQAISVITHGMVYGFDLSNVTYGSKVYLSETAGALYDTDPGPVPVSVEVGECWPLPDSSVTKVLFVDINIGDEAHS